MFTIVILILFYCFFCYDQPSDEDFVNQQTKSISSKHLSSKHPYVIVMTICGEQSFHQGIISLKSILIFHSNQNDQNQRQRQPPLHFIIMTDPEMMNAISHAVMSFEFFENFQKS